MHIIRGGTLVSSRHTWRGDLALEGGRIAALAPSLTPGPGDRVTDATGCLVFPGFVDPHTHLDMDNGVTVTADDFSSGTLAALWGGTTTLVDFATQDRGSTLKEALAAWHARAEGHCSCNYAFHMAVTDWNETTRGELEDMVAAGVTSLKVYLAYDGLRLGDAQVLDLLLECRRLGLQVGCHCENGDLVTFLQGRELSRGNRGPAAHPLSRPSAVEAEAISRYCRIASLADCPVTVVHLSSEAGLEEVRSARRRGQTVWVETCPQYLLLEESCYRLPGFAGAGYVMSPPLRSPRDREALRQAVVEGEVDTIATDHCSYNLAGQKELGREDFTRIPNGAPGVEHRPALFWTSFVRPGLVTPQRMCALLAENPARLYGMYPRKGVLREGADGDITVWDPQVSWTITASRQHQRVDYTPYEGMPVWGAPRAVFLNGEPVLEGETCRRNRGRYVPRSTLPHGGT